MKTKPKILPESGKSELHKTGLRSSLIRATPNFLFFPARKVLSLFKLATAFAYDFKRLWQSSSAINRGDTKEKLSALITIQYHGIEKGMSLPEPRPGFGKEKIMQLLRRIDKYTSAFGWDQNTINAMYSIESYISFCEQEKADIDEIRHLYKKLAEDFSKANLSCQNASGGIRKIRRVDFEKDAKKDLESFFHSRSSVRQFTNENVENTLIEQSIKIAQRSPCVCNRQSCRVHLLKNKKDIADALDIQKGANGFSHQVPALLIITSDLSFFQSAGERNQCWIDGGLFAMSLIWGLHSKGICSCCLNWSKMPVTDKEIRARFSFKPSESMLFMLAIGYPPQEFRVAQSTRKPLEEVFIQH